MHTRSQVIFSALAVSALMPLAALAQPVPNPGYVLDSQGKIVMSSVAGLCWHTSQWTPAMAVEECDPTLKKAAVAPAPIARPAEIAAAPMLAPPVARPQPMPAQKLTFSADALFDFDKSVIRPAGITMLDDLAFQLRGAEYDVVIVTGHADRIGTTDYNQKLSERRANEVKAYLVSKNVPATRITATGQGESQPVPGSSDCTGPKSAKLIACLQADRRVDVDMSGSKMLSAN